MRKVGCKRNGPQWTQARTPWSGQATPEARKVHCTCVMGARWPPEVLYGSIQKGDCGSFIHNLPLPHHFLSWPRLWMHSWTFRGRQSKSIPRAHPQMKKHSETCSKGGRAWRLTPRADLKNETMRGPGSIIAARIRMDCLASPESERSNTMKLLVADLAFPGCGR
jgi:hypothetical protein